MSRSRLAADLAPIRARLRGRPLAILLDIDGTVCDLMPTPHDVRMPDEMRTVLQRLARLPDVHVALVTGRSVADARRLVGVEGIHVYGNHGIEIGYPSGDVEVDVAVLDAELALRTAATTLSHLVIKTPGALLEDKRYTLSVHYRLATVDTVARLRESAREVANRYGLHVTDGNCVIELRPPHAADKGRAVLRFVRDLGADAPEAAVLFAGDDVTDEDACQALRTHIPHAVTINVGGRVSETVAEYRLRNPEVLRHLLVQLADTNAGHRARRAPRGASSDEPSDASSASPA